MAADHDRRMWALAWLGLEADAIEGGVAPLEARQLLGPEDADRLQVLGGDGAAVLERDAERAELRLDVTAPEAGDEPPTGDQVERRERLREQHRVVVREDEDARAQAEAARVRGHVRERDQRVEEGRLRRRGHGVVADR